MRIGGRRMNKRIMLTFMGICAILTCVGCENGKKLETPTVEELVNKGTQEEIATQEEIVIPEVYHYNESGKIIIVMYHKFTSRK